MNSHDEVQYPNSKHVTMYNIVIPIMFHLTCSKSEVPLYITHLKWSHRRVLDQSLYVYQNLSLNVA